MVTSDRLANVRPPSPSADPVNEAPTKRRWWGLRAPKANKPNPWMLRPDPYAHLSTIGPARLGGMLDGLNGGHTNLDNQTELEIRRWLWWSWNHATRGMQGWMLADVPEASQDMKRENLERLLPLLLCEPSPDWMQIGDAHRQLAQFDEACRAYGREVEAAAWVGELTALAGRRSSRCVEISYLR